MLNRHCLRPPPKQLFKPPAGFASPAAAAQQPPCSHPAGYRDPTKIVCNPCKMPPSFAVSRPGSLREPLLLDREPPPSHHIRGMPPPTVAPRRGLLSSMKRTQPLFRFGLVADIQYSCKEPETKRRGKTVTRIAWTESLRKLDVAVRSWNAVPGLSFVQSLGDIIEGNESYLEDLSERELRAVLARLSQSHAPVAHVLGNHCRRLSAKKLLPMLGMTASYYDFVPTDGWRVICLDTTQLCAAAVDASSEDKHTLRHMEKRLGRAHASFNGAVADDQLVWFVRVLARAKAASERVIIMTHYPLKSGSARDTHIALNAGALLGVMSKSGADVVAVFAGHDHVGGFVKPDARGGPAFITIPALLEAPVNAFATVSVFADGSLNIAGHGSVQSRKIRARAG